MTSSEDPFVVRSSRTRATTVAVRSGGLAVVGAVVALTSSGTTATLLWVGVAVCVFGVLIGLVRRARQPVLFVVDDERLTPMTGLLGRAPIELSSIRGVTLERAPGRGRNRRTMVRLDIPGRRLPATFADVWFDTPGETVAAELSRRAGVPLVDKR